MQNMEVDYRLGVLYGMKFIPNIHNRALKKKLLGIPKKMELLSQEQLILAYETGVISKKEYQLLMDLKLKRASDLPPRTYLKTMNALCQKGFLSKSECVIPF